MSLGLSLDVGVGLGSGSGLGLRWAWDWASEFGLEIGLSSAMSGAALATRSCFDLIQL